MEGTAEPVACPPGTFGATQQLTNVSGCTPCHAGKYCEQSGLLDNQGIESALWLLQKSRMLISLFLCEYH